MVMIFFKDGLWWSRSSKNMVVGNFKNISDLKINLTEKYKGKRG
jgi:hypothetical protein